MASDLSNPPFAALDEDQRPIGRDVEMMEAIGAQLGRRIVWKRMPFDELLDSVEAGQVDLACATLGITPERAERVLFSRPYFRTEIAVLSRAGEGEPKSLRDLRGRRVYAGKGTTSEDAARRELGTSELVLDPKEGSSTAQRLLDGDIDAAVMDGPNVDQLVVDHAGQLLRLGSVAEETYALAIRPDGEALKSELDAALAELERDGLLGLLDVRFGLVAIPVESTNGVER